MMNQLLIDRHRARMKAMGVPLNNAYDTEVVNFAIDSWKNGAELEATHGVEETGCCVYCDAARLLDQISDEL